ncbi:MAG: sigma-70 family RNA polymerase sigma factor [Pseudomonadota bacterium]
MAVLRGVEESVRLHVDRGDDVNARDEHGRTPLMLSAARNNGRICRLLLDAGAKSDLIDSQGNDALAIAIQAGASEARLALEAHLALCPASYVPDQAIFGASVVEEAPPAASQLANGWPAPTSANPGNPDSVPAVDPHIDSINEILGAGDWEAEDVALPSNGDPTLVAPTFAAQAAITQHIPVDTSADWSDFEVVLPDWATPLLRNDEGDIRDRLRALILRALRESSVPSFAVQDLSRESDGSVSEDGEAQLRMVLNDLGAEVDERLEIDFPFESHVVFVDPRETEDEEKHVDAALAYLDDLASRHNDSIRIYLKTGLRGKLLSAEEEADLAKAMESSIAKALDALSGWDEGLARVRESAELIRSGIHPLRWMTLGQNDESEDMGVGGTDVAVEPEEVFGDGSDEATSAQRDSAIFFAGIDLLGKVMDLSVSARAKEPPRCGKILEALRLRRDFLLGLTNASGFEKGERGAQFDRAIDGYLAAREQMTTANLKLALSVAKKYLYTEEPFDDLIQEANMGLMKAVDKFDWRRGFRFSTYATPWIRQSVQRYVADKCSVIRVPVHVHETTQKILRHMRIVETRDGREPSPQEIADALSMPLKKVNASLHAAAGSHVASLDEADESLAIEFAENFLPKDPADAMVPAQMRASIEELLLELKPKDAGIIRMRNGLGVNDAMTLEEIGQRFEVTRERIRQMEAKAIRQLKHPARLAKFIEQIHGKPDSYYAEVELLRLESLGFKVDNPLAPKTSKVKPFDTSRVSFKDDELIGDEETFDHSERVSLPALDEVLEEARGLGINVDEREEDGSRRIWIEILETPDTPSHMLVRRMLQQGFKFWPQRGYWL